MNRVRLLPILAGLVVAWASSAEAQLSSAPSATYDVHAAFTDRLGAAVGDFDRDSHVDLTVATTSAGIVTLRNQGDGTFAAPIILSARAATGVIASDFDGDGWLDMAFPVTRGDVCRSLRRLARVGRVRSFSYSRW